MYGGRSARAVSRSWITPGSMREVIVAGPTQVMRAGQIRTPSVSWTSARATSMPRVIWAAGPRSSGAGSASVTDAPASAWATSPVGSKETTTTGVAPPDQATSAIRRTDGTPSAPATAPSGLADRITAATVMAAWYGLGPSRVRRRLRYNPRLA